MRFPECDRVRFRNHPLIEVICQVRFPRVTAIDSDDAVAPFLEFLKPRFPAQEQRPSLQVTIEPNTRAIQTVQNVERVATTLDGNFQLVFGPESLALQVTKYDQWENFAELWNWALDGFRAIFNPPYAVRAGLRYQDLIIRSKLEVSGSPWSTLVRPEVFPASLSEEEDAWEGYQSVYVRNLGDGTKAMLRIAIVDPVPPPSPGERAILIDTDCFREQPVPWEAVPSLLRVLNEDANRAFRWCLMPKLYSALGPEPVEAAHA